MSITSGFYFQKIFTPSFEAEIFEWKASQFVSLAYAQSNRCGPTPVWTYCGLKTNSPCCVSFLVRAAVRTIGALTIDAAVRTVIPALDVFLINCLRFTLSLSV